MGGRGERGKDAGVKGVPMARGVKGRYQAGVKCKPDDDK